MSDRSRIEWTDASWNPVRARRSDLSAEASAPAGPPAEARQRVGWHCEHVSEGCRNCYAEVFNKRLGTGLDYKPGHRADLDILIDEKTLAAPLRWRALKQRSGSATTTRALKQRSGSATTTRARKIFAGSMTDLFADFVTDATLDRIFAVAALCPQHTYQFLTKRPERMRAYITARSADPRPICDAMFALKPITGLGEGARYTLDLPNWLDNVWLGVSCEDQDAWDSRLGHLAATPAAVRFVSVEPMLGGIDAGNAFDDESDSYRPIDWVICGGESGPNARPMHPDWARSLRDQCVAAGVPFFFKQWGEWAPDEGPPREGPDVIMEGRARCAVFAAGAWRHFENGYRPDCSAPDGDWVYRLGKARAGRLLDGREWNEFPERAA